MDNLFGVILCGGESRRMGRDKGLLDTGGGLWVTRLRDKLAPLPILYSINPAQWDAYSRILPPHQLITDRLSFPAIHGPLKGLLSVHEIFPDKDLLLVACDMQDLDARTIDKVTGAYTCYGQRPDRPDSPPDQSASPSEHYDFFIYRDRNFFQPFCGVYTARGLSYIHRMASLGHLRDSSLQSILKEGRTKGLSIDNSAAFRNYNSL